MFGNLKLTAVGALLLGFVVAAAGIARSDNASEHTNYITFSRGVALPGVELAAGTYIFETPSNALSNSIVRVSSRDRRKVFLTTYTRQVARPKNDQGKLIVTLGEAAPGSAPPVSAWFPIGESLGHEFVYVK